MASTVCILRGLVRPSTARLAMRRHEAATPVRRLLVTSPRAQEKSDVPAAPSAAGAEQTAVAPTRGLGMLSPSFSRMTQVRVVWLGGAQQVAVRRGRRRSVGRPAASPLGALLAPSSAL